MNRANIISANNGLHLYGPLFDFHSQLAVSHISSAASLDLSEDDTHFIVAPWTYEASFNSNSDSNFIFNFQQR